jgi:hypothetical protein
VLPLPGHRDIRDRPTLPHRASDRRGELLEGIVLLVLLTVLAFLASALTAVR